MAKSVGKDAESEALSTLGKVILPKDVAPKASSIKGAGIDNVGVAGTLAGTGSGS
jgi:hypothetical protein